MVQQILGTMALRASFVVGVFLITEGSILILQYIAYMHYLKRMQEVAKVRIPTVEDPSGKTPISYFSLVGMNAYKILFTRSPQPIVERARYKALLLLGAFILWGTLFALFSDFLFGK